mmetsp:Transcript_41410/g.118446  ORF Transcript_41410/g.118446 Transcript_41410/m.118446 type:complete len:165 (+) Transcript_41410:494-988(+)
MLVRATEIAEKAGPSRMALCLMIRCLRCWGHLQTRTLRATGLIDAQLHFGWMEVSLTQPLSAFGGPEALSALEDFQAGVSLHPPGEFPTEGSKGHQFRVCKPCAFVNTKGCKDGVECKFCHLCGPGEKKRRKKERTTFWRNLNGNIISGWQGQPQSDTARWQSS